MEGFLGADLKNRVFGCQVCLERSPVDPNGQKGAFDEECRNEIVGIDLGSYFDSRDRVGGGSV